MTIDLTQIIQAIIALLAALITSRLIPWIKARTTNEQQAAITAAIRVAVYAAEQVYGAGRGAEKKEFAMTWLAERGFTVDSTEVEAEVMRCFNAAPELVLETGADDAESMEGAN